MKRDDWLERSVIRDMSEGVMIIGVEGAIEYLNPAAEDILKVSAEKLTGVKFAKAFFECDENDAFNQAVLDAVYDTNVKQYNLVPYFTGEDTRQLRMLTSRLRDEGGRTDLIVMLDDITEMVELKIRYAEQVTAMMESMVRALSTAIDERSRYNGNHTRNMVKMAEAFLDWMEQTDHPWRFEAEKRRAFLMSVWLHDVGKLTVPLEVMDKATRLGPALERIEERFARIRLLDRIAALEGRITEAEREARAAEWDARLALIQRINAMGYLPEETLAEVQRLAEARYVDEANREQPLLTPDEIEGLSIRKGTLTKDERSVMQSHATVTRIILSQIEFPRPYAMVVDWASSHHELLTGSGYPNHRRGDEIPREVRLLTILDIFEALTARDRPYKKPMPLDRALDTLHSMCAEGSLDSEILGMFEESRAWDAIL